jgi:hypothetical protein
MTTTIAPRIITLPKPIISLSCQNLKHGKFDLSQAILFVKDIGHLTTPLQISGVQIGKKISKNSMVRISDINGRHQEEEVLISQLQNPEKIIECLKQAMEGK